MDYIEVKKFLIFLQKNLSSQRFGHCLRVAEEAKKLSLFYGENPEKGYLAGLLHDYARDWKKEVLQSALPSWVEEEAYSVPEIWHALAGPSIIAEDLNVRDYQILHAVRWHATACENMSLFDKIIFVADITEEGRDFKEASWVRREAWRDLQKGYRMALAVKMNYLLSTGKLIYPASVRAWNKENGTK
ncbi:MAG: bis(5'-nucleosyl)-tetraphosphatase (symmetrical) YqeK [Candidatus Caldatribacteriaceae bacterium]